MKVIKVPKFGQTQLLALHPSLSQLTVSQYFPGWVGDKEFLLSAVINQTLCGQWKLIFFPPHSLQSHDTTEAMVGRAHSNKLQLRDFNYQNKCQALV